MVSFSVPSFFAFYVITPIINPLSKNKITMCKLVKPQIPADATADERRRIMFDALSSLDLSDKVVYDNAKLYQIIIRQEPV